MTLVIIKYIVVLVVVYGIAWMLNKKYFNEKPLSSGKSFLLDPCIELMKIPHLPFSSIVKLKHADMIF